MFELLNGVKGTKPSFGLNGTVVGRLTGIATYFGAPLNHDATRVVGGYAMLNEGTGEIIT